MYVHTDRTLLCAVSQQSVTHLQFVSACVCWCNAMRLQYKSPGADVAAKDHDDVTALMNAAESGSLAAVEALLEKGADAGSMSTTAFTPLIVAAAGGHLDVVKVGGWVGVRVDGVLIVMETSLLFYLFCWISGIKQT